VVGVRAGKIKEGSYPLYIYIIKYVLFIFRLEKKIMKKRIFSPLCCSAYVASCCDFLEEEEEEKKNLSHSVQRSGGGLK
jgi:hypothetical protein